MALVYVDSFDDARLDAYVRLTEPQLRNKLEPEKGIFIAESFKVIERALQAGHEPLSFLLEEKWIERCGPMFAELDDIPQFVLPSDEIRKLTGFTLTRGILAAMKRPVASSVEDVVCNARRIAVLEGLTDHTNLGAIFRSAAALGVDAVLLTPTCCDPLYRRSVRVSMGAVFQVPWAWTSDNHTDWPDKGLATLSDLGFQTAAFALVEDTLDLHDEKLATCEKLALVFGTEADGLSKQTIAQCNYTVKIPMAHGVDSLNVAASSAVAFYELCR